MPDLSGYAAWLTSERYQPTTIEATLRHLKNVAEKPDSVANHQTAHVRRYLRYVSKTQRHPFGRGFTKNLRDQGFEAAGDVRKPGSRSKKLLTGRQWAALRSRLRIRGGDNTDKMLVAYMESPYRITEFLNLRVGAINAEDVTDKRAREWLKSAGSTIGNPIPVYAVLCATERCTYYRLRKRLRDVCDKMELSADLDTLYKTYYELN
jgi:hypothetical protein